MYCTAADLTERYSADEIAQRADRGAVRLVSAELMAIAVAAGSMAAWPQAEQDAATAALGVADAAIGDACDLVDGYLQGRYRVPIDPTPRILKRIACELARYFLYDDQVTDRVQAAYDANLKFLAAVRDGKAGLGADVAGVEVEGDGGAAGFGASAEVVAGDHVFARDASKGFI